MRLTLGEMIGRFRMEKKVEAKQLCYGVCKTSLMSYIENNERIPDVLMFECFMERLGVSPEHFSIMVSREESKYLEWREQVMEAINISDAERINELLGEKYAKKIYCNEKLELQFIAYAKAVVEFRKENYKGAMEQLQIAAKKTIPEPGVFISNSALLSNLELTILCMYLYCGIKGNCLSRTEAKYLYDILDGYITSDILGTTEKARIYPKFVCIGCHINILKENEKENSLKRAIELLKEEKSLYDLCEVLRLYISLLETTNSKEFSYYKVYYEVFSDLLESENIDTTFNVEFHLIRKLNVYVIQDVLYTRRRALGLTQEDLSEGICEPESYSRIERGKRVPTRNNMGLFSEKLNISWNYYIGKIDTCDPLDFQLKEKQRLAIIEGRYEDALQHIEELEKRIDMKRKDNIQYIKYKKVILLNRLNKITLDEVYSELEELIAMSEYNSKNAELYSNTEIEIIGYMGMTLKKMGEYNRGIDLINSIVNLCCNKEEIEKRWSEFEFILRVLCNLYFEAKQYELCVRTGRYVKSVNTKLREAGSLANILDSIADAYEHMGEQYSDIYMKLYRYTYYVADFYNQSSIKIIAKSYYEEHFDNNMTWY